MYPLRLGWAPILFALSLSAMVANAGAPNITPGPQMDDIMEGFDDAPEETGDAAPAVLTRQSRWDISGWTGLSASYNYAHSAPENGKTDYRGLSRMRIKTWLTLDGALDANWKVKADAWGFHDFAYAINGREQHTDETLKLYENDIQIDTAYIQGSLTPETDLKIGRQVVVWGKSDNVRVTDILNPMDNREPGMADIENLRLPVFMARADYYLGKWNVMAVAIPEIRFDYTPAYGSDFYPGHGPTSPQAGQGAPPAEAAPPAEGAPHEVVPAISAQNTEYAVALNGVFSGFDISFYTARVWDDAPHALRGPAGSQGHALLLKHSRITMFGTAGNFVAGNFLFKYEAAYLDGLEFFNAPGAKKSRADILLGVEYYGFTDNTLSLELVNRSLLGFSAELKSAPDYAQANQRQLAFRYQADFIHQTAHLLALVSFFGTGGEDGGYQRFSMKYDVTDFVSVTAGVVAYQSGYSIFSRNIGNNDRVFLEIRKSFQSAY